MLEDENEQENMENASASSTSASALPLMVGRVRTGISPPEVSFISRACLEAVDSTTQTQIDSPKNFF